MGTLLKVGQFLGLIAPSLYLVFVANQIQNQPLTILDPQAIMLVAAVQIAFIGVFLYINSAAIWGED